MSVDVRLGPLGAGSVAATAFALVERGCLRRPELVLRLPAVTRIEFRDGHPAVRVTVAAVTVDDGAEAAADATGAAAVTVDDGAEAVADAVGTAAAPVGVRVTVGDDAAAAPAHAGLVLRGTPAAFAAPLTVPLAAGLPSPLRPGGRAVLRAVAGGAIVVEGRLADARTLLRLLSLHG